MNIPVTMTINQDLLRSNFSQESIQIGDTINYWLLINVWGEASTMRYAQLRMSDVGVGNFQPTMSCRPTCRRHVAWPTSRVGHFRPRQCRVVSVGSRHVGFTYIGTSTKSTIVLTYSVLRQVSECVMPKNFFSTHSLPLAPNRCEWVEKIFISFYVGTYIKSTLALTVVRWLVPIIIIILLYYHYSLR